MLKQPAVSVYQRWGETKLRLAMLPVTFIKSMTVLGFIKNVNCSKLTFPAKSSKALQSAMLMFFTVWRIQFYNNQTQSVNSDDLCI